MITFNLTAEQRFDPKKHVENILGRMEAGDFTVACWEPGQTSPNHCHPHATEIYFCFEGGGTMRTPNETIGVEPGAFCVHPPGEVHEYINGANRSLLFRVRYGADMETRVLEWPTNPEFVSSAEDIEYYKQHPAGY
ncbi:MAG: cupin domain-containing protein [Pseudomonadota bacterium]|nr:cupin domain-containing protein [Pseudomonadota bacterium]